MDSIKKIVSTDESLQSSAAELEQKRSNLESEISAEKQKIKAELYAKADAEVSRVMASERKAAESGWNSDKMKYKEIQNSLDTLYLKNRDSWAKIIFDRVIKGTED